MAGGIICKWYYCKKVLCKDPLIGVVTSLDSVYAIFHLCKVSQEPKCAYLEDPM